MYNVQAVEDALFSAFEQDCRTCNFRMKCDDMTNSEVGRCFYAYVDSRVTKMLMDNGMNIDVWTWNGNMGIKDLVRLYIYLSVEAESNGQEINNNQ